MNSSPEGTAERKPVIAVFQRSLRDFIWGAIHPSVETLGYFHLSLRDIHFLLSQFLRFNPQQGRFGFQTAGETGQLAVRTDDAVAWNNDGDRIPANRRAHGAHGFGTSDLPGDLPVAERLPERDSRQCLPDLGLKPGALEV